MAKPVTLVFRGDVAQLEAALKQAGLSAQVLDKQGESLGKRMHGVGASMTKVGGQITHNFSLPVGLAAAAATKLAVDFEASTNKMISLVGISKEQVGQWSKELLDLGPSLGRAPEELSDALYFITSSGIDASHAMEVLKASGKAAAIGLGETQVVADAVTSAMNAYGIKNLSAAKATDILLKTVKEGKGEPEELAQSIGRVIAPAQSLGVSFEEVGAAIASMTLVGLDADEATTALRGGLMALTNPTEEQAAALSEMGLTLDGVRQVIAERGLLEGFQMLRDKIGDNVEAGSALFGNVRALNGFMIMTGENAGNTSRIFDSLANSTGAVDQAFAATSQTAQFKFNQSLAELKSAGIEVGNALIPTAISVAHGIADVADSFAKLNTPLRDTLLVFTGIAVAAGPLMTIGGNVVKMAGTVATGFKKIGVSGSIALGGAALLMAGIVDRMQEMAAAARETRAELTKGVSGNNFEDYDARLVEVRQHLEELREEDHSYDGIGGFFKEVFEILPGVTKNAARLNGEVQGNREAFEDLARASRNIQDNLTITGNKLHLTSDEVQELADKTGIDLTQSYTKAVPKLEEAYKAVKAAGPQTDKLAKSNEELASKVSTATEKIDAFKDALDAALGITMDADEATLDYQGKLEDLAKTVAENGTKAGFLTEQQRAVQSATLDVIKAAEDEVVAFQKDGRISSDAAAAKAELVRRLNDVKKKYPELSPVIDGYIAKLQAIPTAPTTTAKFEVAQAMLDVQKYKAALASIPNQAFTRGNFNPNDVIMQSVGAPGRASGGPVSAKTPYLVGEEGPELVVFDAPGMVYPADVTETLLRGGLVIPRADGGLVGREADQVRFEDALAGTAINLMSQQNASHTGTGFNIYLSAFLGQRDPTSELERVGDAYAQLALQVDEATAKELLSQNLTAEQYEDAANRIIRATQDQRAAEKAAAEDAARERERAADELARATALQIEKQKEIQDNQYAFGVLSKDQYLDLLNQRIAGEEEYTNAWASLVRQRDAILKESNGDQAAILRNQFQMGAISTEKYLASLDEQIAATKAYSDEWMRLTSQRATVERSVMAAGNADFLDLLDRGLGEYLPTSGTGAVADSSGSVAVHEGAVQVTVQVDGSVDEETLAQSIVKLVGDTLLSDLTRAIRVRR